LTSVATRRHIAPVLDEARRTGQLPRRVTHGDPKLNNFLFDPAGAAALALIDLDTVQAGLVHYDLGDCLRSWCNQAGEEAPTPGFDLAICRALLAGYLGEARKFLEPGEYPFLYPAIRLLPLELGLRFLTDHLEGDWYFKVRARGQNLRRALTQFQLVECIESVREDILRMLDDIAGG
jgi:Ser/Thr protein kinase RdoA (MazF antagonist)